MKPVRSLAVCVVRNSVDLIALSVLHHCLMGVERCVVIDNGSSDGTYEQLIMLAKRLPKQLIIIQDPLPFRQSELVSGVINDYTRLGSTIVVIFDGDECWNVSLTCLEKFFSGAQVNVAMCDVVNFVQSSSVVQPSAFSWAKTCRSVKPIGGDVRSLVREGKIAFVEIEYPRKVIFCAHGNVTVQTGAHGATLDGYMDAPSDFKCLHLPLRARSEIVKRAYDYESRRAPLRPNQGVSWQSLYFKERADQGAIDLEWSANSYDATGCLNLSGRKVRSVIDFRLVAKLLKAYAYAKYLQIPLLHHGAA